ncbi:hypothetical protein FJTKL_13432 [Diaporthe vaccinii]|uniref:Uncharacterized protein n=1 Tax=Diaporthe vaccinii TaxID=105482 RepID=A0ABR4EAD2_9PEZI
MWATGVVSPSRTRWKDTTPSRCFSTTRFHTYLWPHQSNSYRLLFLFFWPFLATSTLSASVSLECDVPGRLSCFEKEPPEVARLNWGLAIAFMALDMDRWREGLLAEAGSTNLRFELQTSRPESRQYRRSENSRLAKSYMRKWKSWTAVLLLPGTMVSTRRFMFPSVVKSSCLIDRRAHVGFGNLMVVGRQRGDVVGSTVPGQVFLPLQGQVLFRGIGRGVGVDRRPRICRRGRGKVPVYLNILDVGFATVSRRTHCSSGRKSRNSLRSLFSDCQNALRRAPCCWKERFLILRVCGCAV